MAEPSILGALRDPQFRSDTLRNLVEALNGAKRSLTVGSLGAVGDMGNTLANLVRAGAGTAYHEATGRPIPQALEYRDPALDFGTSASLGNFAERQGWLPPQTGSIPETAGALLGPIVAMKAPDLAQSTLRGLVSALKSEPSRRMVEGLVDGMGARPKIFAGEGAQTADMQALAKAQQLEKAGAPERAIWSDTGWFRGADKKWRFEIDDSGARLRDYNFTPQEAFQNTPYADRAEMAPYASKSKADLVSEYKRTGSLIADAATRGDTDKAMQMLQDRSGLDKLFDAMRSRTYGPASSFMAHGELGAAYPDVYKLHTRIDNDLAGAQGQYLRGDRTQGEQIVLGSKPKWSDGKSTFLHELQHAVQQREGFAAGGNPSSISLLDMVPAERIESVKQSPLYRLQVAQGRDPKKALEGILAPYLDEFGGGNAGNARMDAYRRLAGEAEARAVQSRMDMTPEQRRATFPFDSYDVPRDKLILRDLLKGPAEASRPRPMQVRPAKERLSDVADSNFDIGIPQGDKTVNINSLAGRMSSAADDAQKVDALAKQMASDGGYIERLIVDQFGNVIEGQHRLNALRKLGVKDVPVSVINDYSSTFEMLTKSGMRPEHARNVVQHSAEMLKDSGTAAKVLEEYELPRGYEDAFRAALKHMSEQ